MKIYFAGNFPLMKNPELEKEFRDRVITSMDYRRLLSFYYKDDIQNLIDIKKKEEENGSQ